MTSLTGRIILLISWLVLACLFSSCGTNADDQTYQDTTAVTVEVPVIDTLDDDGIPQPSNDISPAQDLLVTNAFGEKVTITPDSNTVYCSYATWCPFSKQLRECLNDPEIKKILGDTKFVFVVEGTEWPTMRRKVNQALEENEITKEQADKLLASFEQKELVSPLVNESILENLDGDIYYFSEASNLKIAGFPTIMSMPGNNFEYNALVWLTAAKGVPSELIAKYEPQ